MTARFMSEDELNNKTSVAKSILEAPGKMLGIIDQGIREGKLREGVEIIAADGFDRRIFTFRSLEDAEEVIKNNARNLVRIEVHSFSEIRMLSRKKTTRSDSIFPNGVPLYAVFKFDGFEGLDINGEASIADSVRIIARIAQNADASELENELKEVVNDIAKQDVLEFLRSKGRIGKTKTPKASVFYDKAIPETVVKVSVDGSKEYLALGHLITGGECWLEPTLAQWGSGAEELQATRRGSESRKTDDNLMVVFKKHSYQINSSYIVNGFVEGCLSSVTCKGLHHRPTLETLFRSSPVVNSQ